MSDSDVANGPHRTRRRLRTFRNESPTSDRNPRVPWPKRLAMFLCGYVSGPRWSACCSRDMRRNWPLTSLNAEAVDMNDARTLTTVELQQGLDRDSGLHLLN